MKNKALRDPQYLLFLRTQPCLISGLYAYDGESVVACHVGTRGRGIKSGDDEALPLLDRWHRLGHQHGEVSMFRENLPDDVLRAALRAYAREKYREWKESR